MEEDKSSSASEITPETPPETFTETPTNTPQSQPNSGSKKKLIIVSLAVVASALLLIGLFLLITKKDPEKVTVISEPAQTQQEPVEEIENRDPELEISEVIGGYSKIWDVKFLDDENIIFDERKGELHGMNLTSGEAWLIADVPNVWASGEGGLLGIATDVDFASNKTAYLCHNTQVGGTSVWVVKITLSDDYRQVLSYDTIIDDIQSQAGRHSGCRMQMDKSAHLWIGTGDSAIGTAPVDPNSLAGKTLRVDRNGNGVEGNLGAPFDSRIFSYGHRNIQGLVLFDEPMSNGAVGLTAEHGPNVEDEMNWIIPGNFGWDPDGDFGTYDESVPMTDTERFPDANVALWNSGSSTIAVCDVSILDDDKWLNWKNYAVVATLKGKHLRLIEFTEDGQIVSERKTLEGYGRLRAVTLAPDGDLFITTDNGEDRDVILRVTPV